MSIFAGSMAKVILANVSAYQLKNLMLHHAEELRVAGLGDNWKEFNANMQKIRKARVYITRGEVVPELTGVAAPVFDHDRRVQGSITLVVNDTQLDRIGASVLSEHIDAASEAISQQLAQPV